MDWYLYVFKLLEQIGFSSVPMGMELIAMWIQIYPGTSGSAI